ncbi:NepR family anti-sigma factor [Novosphingobium sp.]|uniref:NepR family anti-sigma factor n=1 Tax=Novosphingobium sp. TaxID=1874826 RepID=UPI00286DD9FD|nr:NepR family anti-sigma factor [Novosphingobium sp.]
MPPRRDPQGTAGAGKQTSGRQGWADGLRKLYDGVVSEPLPDSFEDLLKRLDKDGNG